MSLSEDLLGAAAAGALLGVFQAVHPRGNWTQLSDSVGLVEARALRERSDQLRDGLLSGLPHTYEDASSIISAAAQRTELTGWIVWPVTTALTTLAVQDGGAAAYDDAMALLEVLTGKLTGEFAIRSLLRHDLQRGLDIARTWTLSEDEHVRRLASEGTRPYLPWATRVPGLITDPNGTIDILDALYRDESEYVRRSVANHLNDISRHSPELVVTTAQRWLENPGPETTRVVRHALRTLIKKGDPGALELLGFRPVGLTVIGPILERASASIGEALGFTATVRNDDVEQTRLAVDYIVHHVKANGARTEKVFKLTTATLEPGKTLDLSRTHSFRVISTRKYYPGTHALELQVNGVRYGKKDFELLEEPA